MGCSCDRSCALMTSPSSGTALVDTALGGTCTHAVFGVAGCSDARRHTQSSFELDNFGTNMGQAQKGWANPCKETPAQQKPSETDLSGWFTCVVQASEYASTAVGVLQGSVDYRSKENTSTRPISARCCPQVLQESFNIKCRVLQTPGAVRLAGLTLC